MKKLIIIFCFLATAGFTQNVISLKQTITIKGGVVLTHWIAAEVNVDWFHNKTTVMMVPYFSKAARIADINNDFREYTKTIIFDTCYWTKTALKAKLLAPKWKVNKKDSTHVDSVQTNFFYNSIDD